MNAVIRAWPTVAAAMICCVAVAPNPAAQEPNPPAAGQPPGACAPGADGAAPTAASLGLPVYPSARFLTAYEAGRGQCYYLFGSESSFTDMVNYYRVLLDERGDRVFDEPATHMFEVGRFRERSMAFPPGVTVKDYGADGAQGYLHVAPGAEPQRFPTIIQIVPAPAGADR